MKTYIEELLTIFSGFHQTVFSFLTAHSLQQLFPQLTAHSNFFHSHNPTKQTLNHSNCITAHEHELDNGHVISYCA
jgi:metallophosphoesterase superfamily enzyme